MSALDTLLTALASKPPEVRADFVGHLAFNVIDDLDVAALPADMRADLERFIERAGFEEDDSVETTRARIDTHFEAHALDRELVALFDALEAHIATDEATQGNEQARAASAALGTAVSNKPVGAGGRPEGTMAGGLMGLLAARTGKATPSSAPVPTRAAAAPRSSSQNPAPPSPNPGRIR